MRPGKELLSRRLRLACQQERDGPRGMLRLPALAHAVRGVGARLHRLVQARLHSERRPEGL